ncbi:hypothetical protein KC19_2G059700 [Ceratodon purpureus]|uniref:Uncharacterized protein n=1 Tax=Ceratodon purpureus TaxID=3225 RepID=A0A8T0ITQ8_CERPU|nr:hypothetical protein KC19_2G059700 [Ceratodon purpureus]
MLLLLSLIAKTVGQHKTKAEKRACPESPIRSQAHHPPTVDDQEGTTQIPVRTTLTIVQKPTPETEAQIVLYFAIFQTSRAVKHQPP